MPYPLGKPLWRGSINNFKTTDAANEKEARAPSKKYLQRFSSFPVHVLCQKPCHEFGAPLDAKLDEDMAQVKFDCLLADVQFLADGRVGHPLRAAERDLSFAPAQVVEADDALDG